MPDETLNPVDVNEEETEQTQKIDKPYGAIELVTFGNKSKLKGFQFYQKQYKTTQSAIDHVNSLGKNGEEVICGLINSAISFATRTKASNSAPEAEKEQDTPALRETKLAKGGAEIILVTEEEAEKYVPGTRERYALGYFQREYLKARKEYAENKTETNKQKFLDARDALNKAMDEDLETQLASTVEAPAPAPTA